MMTRLRAHRPTRFGRRSRYITAQIVGEYIGVVRTINVYVLSWLHGRQLKQTPRLGFEAHIAAVLFHYVNRLLQSRFQCKLDLFA